RGVMGAAQSVGTIADVATASIDSLRHLVGGFEGTDTGGVARAIRAPADRRRPFVADLVGAPRPPAASAGAALRTAAELGRAARAIDNLASEAKTLAINSRIEAGRTGAANRAFSVVSDEMRRLSADVAATNTTVRRLSETVAGALGSVAR